MDRVTREQRSKMMAAVRSKDTKPERFIRRELHAQGYRFRLHRRDLPGKPDIVFPSRQSAIFVNGCFWHGHDCPAGALPATRLEFWESKIGQNKDRDAKNRSKLEAAGWNVLVVWECDLRQPKPVERIVSWLEASRTRKPGRTNRES